MKRFVALLLVVTLLIPSALFLEINTSKADSPSDHLLYFDDFKDYVSSLDVNQQYTASLYNIFNLCDENFNTANFQIYLMIDSDGNFAFTCCFRTNGDGIYGSGWTDPREYQIMNGNIVNSYYSYRAMIVYYNGSFRYCQTMSVADRTVARRSILNIGTVNSPTQIFISPFEFESEGWQCYTLRTITSGNANGYAASANIVEGHAPAPSVDVNLVYFELGQRAYLTLSEQEIVRRFDPEKQDYDLYLSLEQSPFELWLDYATLVNCGNISAFVDYSQFTGLGVFEDVVVDFIYAWDITTYKDMVVDGGHLYQLDGDPDTSDDPVGNVLNVPFTLSLGGGQPDTQTQSYTYISEYIYNYPNESITPQELAVQMFGNKVTTAGMGCLSIPQDLYDYLSNLLSWNTSCDLPDHFEYKLSTDYYNPAETDMMNFNLFSVCIVPPANYWYESNLSNTKTNRINVYVWDDGTEATSNASGYPKYAANMTMNEIIDSFDCVIFLANNTRTDALFSNFYSDQPDFRLHPTMSYTSAEYNPYMDYDSLKYYGGADPCFVLFTNHAIQKNQMYLFSDGMNKTYRLLSDYVEKRDLWDSSFFSWSMSIFSTLQTLDGSLNKIYDFLFNLRLNDYFQSVLDKLDQLVDNTDEQTHNYWILPLYNFVQSFVPSLTGFSNWIDSIEDFGEGMPEIPMITVPALPTIEPTPYLIP